MKTKKILLLLMPWLIIGGLLYAGFFLKPKPTGKTIAPQSIEQRDNFYGVSAPTTTAVWAVGSYSKIVRSDDSGKTWVVQKSPESVHLQSIAAWDDTRAVAVGNKGVILITANGGKTWVKAEAPLSGIANKLLKVRAYKGGSAWAVGEMGAVLSSNDYGITWKRAIQEQDRAWNDICFFGQRGLVVGEFGHIKMTNNNGESWKDIDSSIKTSLTAVYFKNELEGVAVGLEGATLFTQDGGDHWTVTSNVTKEHLFSVLWDGKLWLAVGDKGILLTSKSCTGPWDSKKTSPSDLSWYTEITNSEDNYYLAGANFGLLKNGILSSFKRLPSQ